MNFKSPIKLIILAFAASFIISCQDPKLEFDENPKPLTLSPTDSAINYFIFSGMYNYYLWVDDVPELSLENYRNDFEIDTFLNQFNKHEALFNRLLYLPGQVDRFSWIVEDYDELYNQLYFGISKSMGYQLQLARIDEAGNIVAVIMYVQNGTPAHKAGLKRGDMFAKVNNSRLTIDNYESLLEQENISITLGSVGQYGYSDNGKTLYISAIEIKENPILLDTVYTVYDKKVGYLIYNGFVPEFDYELHEVFKEFKNKGIQQLILDLRYNGGGSGITTKYLAGMIYGTDKSKIFSKISYNKEFQKYIINTEGSNALNDYFVDTLGSEGHPTTTITSLNLKKLYVITSGQTASASEMLITCLKPYMEVVQIGDTTFGKFVGSVTIQDIDKFGNLNPNHKWAMQPIVLRYTNSQNTTYKTGIPPTRLVTEDLLELGQLGSTYEPLLSKTISTINGNSVLKSINESNSLLKSFNDRGKLNPMKKELFFNKNNLIGVQ